MARANKYCLVLCAGSAIVQGMDQTAVNGAQMLVSLRIRKNLFTLDDGS
jgi:hypothetical protein